MEYSDWIRAYAAIEMACRTLAHQDNPSPQLWNAASALRDEVAAYLNDAQILQAEKLGTEINKLSILHELTR